MTYVVLLAFVVISVMVILRLLQSLPIVLGLGCSGLVVGVVAVPIVGFMPLINESQEAPNFQDVAYRTSTSCASCHADHHHSWHETFHRSMTQEATAESILAPFDGATIRVAGYPCRPYMRDGRAFMRLVDPDWEEAELAAGRDPLETPDPPTVAYSVDRVIGSHHQQVYLSRGERGAYHTLPLVWLKAEQKWTTRSGIFLAPHREGFYHKTKLWNNGCVFCHNTRPKPGLQEVRSRDGSESHAWNTTVAELGIACEACHGPGDEHVRRNQNPMRRYWLREGGHPDPTIVNPARLSKEESVLTCARCHGKMRPKPEFDRECLVAGDFFRPGDWESSKRYVYPELLEDARFRERPMGLYFWPDGTPRTTALEYQGLLLSPCYQHGEMTCLSCHGMHGTDPDDQLLYGDDPSLSNAQQNRACIQCHQDFAYAERLTDHTRHAPQSRGSLCYSCHMPHQSYSLLKRVRSHRITSPDVERTVQAGIPNACNQCHVDRTLGWTNHWLNEWYGVSPIELSEQDERTAAVVLDLLGGHALQRVLAAEQLGSSEAEETAPGNWRVPLLLELLSDPYTAVRHVASRALRRQPGFEDLRFDEVDPQDVREAQELEAWRRWERLQSPASQARVREVLGVESDEAGEKLIQRLLESRPNVEIEVLE